MPMPLDMENKTQWNITATSLTIFSHSLYRSKEKLNYTSCQCFLWGPLPLHNTSISYFRNVRHNRFIPTENVQTIYYVVNSNIYHFELGEENEKFYTSVYLSLAFVFLCINATVFSKTACDLFVRLITIRSESRVNFFFSRNCHLKGKESEISSRNKGCWRPCKYIYTSLRNIFAASDLSKRAHAPKGGNETTGNVIDPECMYLPRG